MSDFVQPNFEDDDIKPSTIDFKRFFKMGYFLLIIFGGVFLFVFSLHFYISSFSIEDEKRVFGGVFIDESMTKMDLNFLNSKVNVPYDIYLSDSDEINAYATLGGNIIFTKGIMNSFKNEEEFLFVLGHEISHIERRDILNYYSKQMPFYITMNYLGINIDTTLISNYFSRENEILSDKSGVEMVSTYGYNTSCILPFFQNFGNDNKYLNFTQDHPTDEKRIKQIKDLGVNLSKECINLKKM